jgi:hypothetical protein
MNHARGRFYPFTLCLISYSNLYYNQQSARPPTATRGALRAPSPLQSRPSTSQSRPATSSPSRPTTSSPSRPTSSSRDARGREETQQMAMRPGNDFSPKLENEVLVLCAKNKVFHANRSLISILTFFFLFFRRNYKKRRTRVEY